MDAAVERWGQGAWCGSGFLQSGAARGFHWGWRGENRVWGMRGFRKSRFVQSGECADCCNPVASQKVWLRIAAILPFPKVFGSGLQQSCRFPKSLAPDCRNPVASKKVWLRIAAILSFPEAFGSGLLQSCRFPKSLAPDCCNLVVSKSVWLRIAAILSFSARNCPDFGKSKKKPAGNGRCFEKSLTFRLPAGRVCRLSIS